MRTAFSTRSTTGSTPRSPPRRTGSGPCATSRRRGQRHRDRHLLQDAGFPRHRHRRRLPRPYYNRMQALDIDTRGTLQALATFIRRFDAPSKIMAASFKNIVQVSHALEAGADAVTLSPKLLRQALSAPDITHAVDDFIDDWHSVYGTKTLPED
ncbi:beta/alpha barrel domain-containing protein [Tessaracoccus coleopterorum]|uniref:transaldolase family protein n=1 Tax=Tessaracoccus coleopterorum TaxID=2714950 RepID=UPI0018D313AD|nr:transaldolase family protein [Tessaracoccus coleopterorum]